MPGENILCCEEAIQEHQVEEQIFREDEWSGDLHRKDNLRVHLVQDTGRYDHGVFVHSRHEALRFVVEYGVQLARVFVTFRDEVILDIIDGMLEFPVDAAPLLKSYEAQYPEWIGPFDGTVVIADWLFDECRRLRALTLDHIERSGFDGAVSDDYDDPVNRLDREVLSVAAGNCYDLARFGYLDPGVLAANRQRFDRSLD